jgi:hypothetical protein
LRNEKQKELLTVSEVKEMIYNEIEKKKRVDPEKFNKRIVEDNLTEVGAIQQLYAMILDEELRRKRYSGNTNGQTTIKPSTVQDNRRLK